MEIFIRGLVALGIALAVAAFGFSQAPAPATTTAGCSSCGNGGSAGHGLFGHGRLFGSGDHIGLHHKPDPFPPHDPHARTQPGTVVFPQHPFARSPRDFFMMD
ncbi:MAG: hypothetical protein ACJ8F7_02670 [Gemmataceae bacterium]